MKKGEIKKGPLLWGANYIKYWGDQKEKGQVLVPLMELPPLSPGIQARVIEEVDVVETVKRGWSGGTIT